VKNDQGHYTLTDADIKAYQRILNATYDLTIRSSGERDLETHGYWSVSAPAKNKTYYKSDGCTLVAAIEQWFVHIEEKGTEPFFE